MNGNRFVLDTNAIIGLLKGNSTLLGLSATAEWIGISIISYLEFLAFPDLSDEDKSLFNEFIQRIDIIGIDITVQHLLDSIIRFRAEYRLKLPDAIIVSTAFTNSARLVTADKQLNVVKEIVITSFD